MKKTWFLLVAAFLLVPGAALAEHGAKDCSVESHGKQCGKCGEKEEGHECPVVDKFMKKAHFFLDYQDELGLSEEQLSTVKALKSDMKKSIIRQEAEMQIAMMDMKAKMAEDKIDVEGLNAMVDQGMAKFAENTKAAVQSYAKLKSVLTAEQLARAKQIWKQKSAEKSGKEERGAKH